MLNPFAGVRRHQLARIRSAPTVAQRGRGAAARTSSSRSDPTPSSSPTRPRPAPVHGSGSKRSSVNSGGSCAAVMRRDERVDAGDVRVRSAAFAQSGDARPTPRARRGRSRRCAESDPAAASRRRRFPTAGRCRCGAGTPSATADPARARSRGRTARRLGRGEDVRDRVGVADDVDRRRRGRRRVTVPSICGQRAAQIAGSRRPTRPRRAATIDRESLSGRVGAWQNHTRLQTSDCRLQMQLAEAGARSALRRLQLSRLGDRSDPDRPALRRATTTARSSAFCAAALAFGRVRACCSRSSACSRSWAPQPAAYVRALRSARATAPRSPASSTAGRASADLVALLWVLRQMLDRAGSIEGFFLEGYDPSADGRRRRARQLLDARAWRSI